MTAPTEAEIRAALRARAKLWPNDNPAKALLEAIEDYANVLTGPTYDVLESPDPREDDHGADEADIWSSDLRASEARALRHLARQAIEAAFRAAEAAIEDELTSAAMQFAAEHPDAPRAKILEPA